MNRWPMREESADQGKQLAQRVPGKNTRKPDAQRQWESRAQMAGSREKKATLK